MRLCDLLPWSMLDTPIYDDQYLVYHFTINRLVSIESPDTINGDNGYDGGPPNPSCPITPMYRKRVEGLGRMSPKRTARATGRFWTLGAEKISVTGGSVYVAFSCRRWSAESQRRGKV